MSDRRQRLRYEIVGRLRGTLVTEERLRVRDIGPGGALLESPWPLQLESVHSVRIESDDSVSTLDVRVRHLRHDPDGHYLIGVEFLANERMMGGVDPERQVNQQLSGPLVW